MPSDALKEYRLNLRDVRRLLAAHEASNQQAPGKRALGHFTRGGMLLLCAAWERYSESVLEESAAFLARRLASASALPASALQATRNHANNRATPWLAPQVNSPTWGAIYVASVQARTKTLNTPKHKQLAPLFTTYIGIADIEKAWSSGKSEIDTFVAHRGDIAHRGGQSRYVRVGNLREAINAVDRYVRETDNFLSDHLSHLVAPPRRPWNRIL